MGVINPSNLSLFSRYINSDEKENLTDDAKKHIAELLVDCIQHNLYSKEELQLLSLNIDVLNICFRTRHLKNHNDVDELIEKIAHKKCKSIEEHLRFIAVIHDLNCLLPLFHEFARLKILEVDGSLPILYKKMQNCHRILLTIGMIDEEQVRVKTSFFISSVKESKSFEARLSAIFADIKHLPKPKKPI